MQAANINLSRQESALVNNADWILMKNTIIDKVYLLMGALQEQMQQQVIPQLPWLPDECHAAGAKISRGEKYKGLPYVILDYPRLFSRENIFAFRSLFWWGHYFSCTLHIRGLGAEQHLPRLMKHYTTLKDNGFYVNAGREEWEHDLEHGSYTALSAMQEETYIRLAEQPSFIKLSKPFPLSGWEDFIAEALGCYKLLSALLNN